jgi:chromosome segregation ATPase
MTNDKSPREFWMNRINVELNSSPVFSASNHVRYYPQEEYAALQKECEELKGSLDTIKKTANDIDYILDTKKENTKLRHELKAAQDEIERLKYESEAANSLGDERIRCIELEREKLRSSLQLCKEALVEIENTLGSDGSYGYRNVTARQCLAKLKENGL